MKVALAQIEVLPNRPDRNVPKMLAMIEEAKRQGCDIVAFPEMCVGGYFLGDRWTEDAVVRDLESYNQDILEASRGIAVAYGNVYVDWERLNKDGRPRKYNAAVVVQDGRFAERALPVGLPEGVHPKTLLPNYRMFDDERYFFSLQDVAKDENVQLEYFFQPFVITVDGRRHLIGVELCEDLWVQDYRKAGRPLNPTRYFIENGAELILNLSASPWTCGKNAARDRRVQFLKDDCRKFVPFYYVNCVGVQNNGKNIITFDGGSTVYDAEGRPVLFARQAYLEELLVVDALPPAKRRVERPRIEQKLEAIVQGIRHVKDFIGAGTHPRFVIGLSGGIDSALAACLLVHALGPDSVMGVNLPTKYNSLRTKDAARAVAGRLGIAYAEVPIGDVVAANERLLQVDLDGTATSLTELNLENVQAKIRGTAILSNLAAKYGALFTNNGNKLETALGYATLYGDVGGAFAPLGDLTKAEVFEMARHINRTYGEVIPEDLIPDELYRWDGKIAPTAELKEAQLDPMKFGYHDALLEAFTDFRKVSPEQVLEWYGDGVLAECLGLPEGLLERWGLDNPEVFVKDLEWFARQLNNSVFKRVQGPPIIITSKSAYGFDIRESLLPFRLTRRFEVLKEGLR